MWISHLAGSCTANTIANYLSALGDYCRMNGYDYNTSRMAPRIKSMLRGVANMFPHITVRKSPITVTHLHQIRNQLDATNIEHATFWAMSLCAFFGLMRLGELTLHTDIRRTLKKAHLQNITAQGITIYLQTSKTDSQWNGNHIFIPKLPSVLCPVTAITNMLTMRYDDIQTLFIMNNTQTFTRERFITLLRLFIPNANISGHSFRAGGATWAAQLGMNELEICRLGRWSSEAFRSYLRCHPMLQYMLHYDHYYQRYQQGVRVNR